jgi:long-subunit acyl-CoA synthetase (AMP-forming)
MLGLLERISHHAATNPAHVAVLDHADSLTYANLNRAVSETARVIEGQRVAVLLDNGCAWAVVDLALACRGAVSIPVPGYFTDDQIRHLLRDADPDLVLTDTPARIAQLIGRSEAGSARVAGSLLHIFAIDGGGRRALPVGTRKVTYTSGTTGQPKGVCLSSAAIQSVIGSLVEAVGARQTDRSLAVLPLATLLQNIAGIYVPLHAGATAALPSLATCGITGSSGVAPRALLGAIHRHAATAIVLVPQLLKMLVELGSAGAALPPSLRFVAVGGAPTGAALMARARALGLPVHEGYGLSEAASVVSLNRAGEGKPGTTGFPLPGVHVRLASDGEIVIRGRLFLGYVGDTRPVPKEWPTGDLGRLDAAGNLAVVGRKKTSYSTAFGRNVAPEWVECELTSETAILQAAVFGEGEPHNVAVLVAQATADDRDLSRAVVAANARLPDYARVAAWSRADSPFAMRNGLADASGAPLRKRIASHYASTLQRLYRSPDLAVDV